MNTAQTTLGTFPQDRSRIWKRLAQAGFMFFLIKGLLWLIAPVVFLMLSMPQ